MQTPFLASDVKYDHVIELLLQCLVATDRLYAGA